MKKYDIGIIGGGILGVCISYWISLLYDVRVCVLEKEPEVAMHASSRNTGVIHSPFYLNPSTKKIIARCSYLSQSMWSISAQKFNLPWNKIGTLEVALDENQHRTLEKYLKWGIENGMSESNLTLLDSNEVLKKESNVSCYSALHCSTDVSVSYDIFTKTLYKLSSSLGTDFLLSSKITQIDTKNDTNIISLDNDAEIQTNFLINCAGGNSLAIAKKLGLATDYSDLHFRGEYWVAKSSYADTVKTNIYSVARNLEFPFLDPHWIKRVDGTTEIGPNAVPVSSPFAYGPFYNEVPEIIHKLGEILSGSSRKLLLNPQFLSMVSKEFKSSISKKNMVQRIAQFIPKIDPTWFEQHGTAGIRTPVISPNGKFVSGILEMSNDNSFHIINYNSPGATGAPVYSAIVVKNLQKMGYLDNLTTANNPDNVWNFESID
ncbi:MAG: FAD-dependent oxidoreductase [Candidatus Nitrosoabyssus spongiisocia]|nr:MAG: FAD-dependent oxidoreductase [Nitrosopumilaceae archaeon AB1(1)]